MGKPKTPAINADELLAHYRESERQARAQATSYAGDHHAMMLSSSPTFDVISAAASIKASGAAEAYGALADTLAEAIARHHREPDGPAASNCAKCGTPDGRADRANGLYCPACGHRAGEA